MSTSWLFCVFRNCSLSALIDMGSGLFILLVLFFHYLVNFKSFLFVNRSLCHSFFRLSILRILPLFLRNVENLEESEIIEFFQIDTFQNDLSNNEVNVLFFQLNLSEKLRQIFLRNGALSILSVGHCC